MALEGAALLGFGGWLLVETQVAQASDDDVAAGSTAYFIVLGLLGLFVAWALWRQRSWAFGAALFTQILALPIAFTMVAGASGPAAPPCSRLPSWASPDSSRRRPGPPSAAELSYVPRHR